MSTVRVVCVYSALVPCASCVRVAHVLSVSSSPRV